MELVAGVLSDAPLFFIINSYTTGLAPSVSPIFWRASSQSATAAAPRAASWAFPSLIPGWFSPAAPLDGGGRTGNENTQGEKAVPPETASLTAALRSPSAFLLFLLFFCFIYMKR